MVNKLRQEIDCMYHHVIARTNLLESIDYKDDNTSEEKLKLIKTLRDENIKDNIQILTKKERLNEQVTLKDHWVMQQNKIKINFREIFN